ncbi:long-chain fatty acid--CoA ligase [soil metagenome]
MRTLSQGPTFPNLADSLRDTAARLPDHPALLGSVTLTYGELDIAVDQVAGVFRGSGLAPGDRVALLLGNCAVFVEAFYGALRAGLVAVPVNNTFTAEEISAILADSGARAVVVGDGYDHRLDGIRQILPTLEQVVVAGASSPPMGTRTWRQFLGGAGDQPPGQPTGTDAGGDDLALLSYTSGTTGKPKGVCLSHANLLANHAQMASTRLRLEADDVVLCVLPLFHIYALNVALAFTIARGAAVVLAERFDPLQTLAVIAEHRVSVIVGAPPMYTAWLNTPAAGAGDLASVRYAVSGAAPLARPVLERFRDELGLEIWEGYGLTETAPVLTSAAVCDRLVAGSAGRPLPGVALRLVDREGRDVQPGDPGEVVVRGPNVFSGYWQQPDATRAVLDPQGWFRTGDIGIDEGGDLFLVDRKADLIIVSGFNVYPKEVEEVLFRHPKVAEAAVIGAPHPYSGEIVRAVVVLRDGEEATAQEISDFCRRSLARFKCPQVVDFVPALPHNLSGKVVRRHLRG